MGSKKVNYDFFVLRYPENVKKDIFDERLDKEYNEENKTEVDIAKATFRIGSITKEKRNEAFATKEENYFWVASVERINTDEESYVGRKGDSTRQTYATDENEGPLNDTVFLYDPKTGVLIVQRSRGGVSPNAMTNYIIALTHNEEIDLEIMIDPKMLDKLDKIPHIKSIEYSIAEPTNLNQYSDKDRQIHGDINMAKKLQGSNLKVVIGADKDHYLEKAGTVKKVKSLITGKNSLSRMKVNGFKDGDEEVLDLVTQRVEFGEKVNAGRGKKVSYIHIMESIVNAFRNRYKMITDYTKEDRIQ